jgi:hypothetical protein
MHFDFYLLAYLAALLFSISFRCSLSDFEKSMPITLPSLLYIIYKHIFSDKFNGVYLIVESATEYSNFLPLFKVAPSSHFPMFTSNLPIDLSVVNKKIVFLPADNKDLS